MPDRAIRKQVSTIAPKPCQPKPNCHTQASTITAVSASTSGYWMEIGALQWRHLPPWMIQLNSGMFSYQASLCLQCGQCEGSTTMPGGGGS
ncbi:hypothetical protein D3C81_1708740 [compost metagenome]